MIFANVNRLDIPDGRVMKIACGSTVLWTPPSAVITEQPESIVAVYGSTATITVAATGAESYEWQICEDGTSWSSLTSWGWAGADTDTLTLSGIGTYHAGCTYRCKVTGYDGNAITTDVVGVTAIAACVITKQPENASAFVGYDASFTIEADNTTYYELQSSADSGATWSKVTAQGDGSTLLASATLTVTVTAENVGYLYRIELRDANWHAAYSDTVQIVEKINWVPESIDTDGSIFNGMGYYNGQELSGSSGSQRSRTGATVTGFIPVKRGDTIRIKGCGWYSTAQTNYIVAYTSSFGHWGTTQTTGGHYYNSTNNPNSYAIEQAYYGGSMDITSDVSTIVIAKNSVDNDEGFDKIAYIRLSVRGDGSTTVDGADLIVTVNREIE